MSKTVVGGESAPFFLAATNGERFCIYHPPAGEARAAVLYVHPFAEEMNKSRRMAALQSRALAAAGHPVLQLDLYGCGDSSGDFGDACWDDWKADVRRGLEWLRERTGGPVYLWGLRLGALLALDCAVDDARGIAGFVLWQPVVNGHAFLTQFLRLRVANEMMYSGSRTHTTQSLYEELTRGAAVEVAGYTVGPQLALAIDRLDLEALSTGGLPAHWFEITGSAEAGISPVSRRIVASWRSAGQPIEARAVPGLPFWKTIQIMECPELCEQTVRALAA